MKKRLYWILSRYSDINSQRELSKVLLSGGGLVKLLLILASVRAGAQYLGDALDVVSGLMARYRLILPDIRWLIVLYGLTA